MTTGRWEVTSQRWECGSVGQDSTCLAHTWIQFPEQSKVKSEAWPQTDSGVECGASEPGTSVQWEESTLPLSYTLQAWVPSSLQCDLSRRETQRSYREVPGRSGGGRHSFKNLSKVITSYKYNARRNSVTLGVIWKGSLLSYSGWPQTCILSSSSARMIAPHPSLFFPLKGKQLGNFLHSGRKINQEVAIKQ